MPRGRKPKLSPEQAEEIRFNKDNKSHAELASYFGVGLSTINKVKRGVGAYPHVDVDGNVA